VDYLISPFGMATTSTTSPASKRQEVQRPEKLLRDGDVSASIFRRNNKGRDYFSVSISRAYKDAAGAWKYAKSFDFEDLGKIVTVCQQADDYIRGELGSADNAA